MSTARRVPPCGPGLACGLLLLLLAAPREALAQPPDQVQQPLTVGATPVSAAEVQQLGLVTVTTRPAGPNGVTCSGVLLTNRWVLTAGHCTDALQGSPTVVTSGFAPGTTFTVDALYKFGSGALDPSGPDISVMRLSQPMPNNGSTSAFFTRLNRTDPVGKAGTIYGASTGAYTKASVTVDRAVDDGRNLQLSSGASGVTTTLGDSGGPAFVPGDGQPLLVGISTSTGAKYAAIHPIVPWLIAATRSFLDQTQPFDSTDAMAEEVRSIPGGGLPALGFALVDTHWARAQRVATGMCTRRGFIGGTFVPDLGGTDGQYRFACIGRSGGRVVQPTQADLDQSGWGFGDIDGVGWAQAGRAALGVCQRLAAGSVGGFFTGSTDRSVVCLNGAAGEFSDVAADQLPIVGRVDLNALDWLAAAQDATRFCRSFGFVGGRPSGNQLGSQRGLTCIGRKSPGVSGFGVGTPDSVLRQTRALYAGNVDEPLVAPPDAAIDVPLTFQPCRSVRLGGAGGCPVSAEVEQWSYDAATRRLLHSASGRCLNISGARRDPGAPIILYPCMDAPNERWAVAVVGGSMAWVVKSELTGMCLHARPGRRSSGPAGARPQPTTLVQMPCDGSAAQRFDNVDADWFRRNQP